MSSHELTLFRTGNALFVQNLYTRQRVKLITYARQYLDDSDEADDAVAETWRVAWEKRDCYRGDGPLEHWLMKICTSVCINALRSRKREAKLLQLNIQNEEPTDIDARVAEAAAFALQNVAATVTNAVNALPPRQRRTVELRHFGNKTTAEAAACMHCAPGTVKANLHKAMKQLAPKTANAVTTLVAARAALASGGPDGYL
jgi:RNA polymerase sigma-70 factor (ECF subfamily)